MKVFRCIGSDCEDTCCAGWRIELGLRDIDDLSRAADRSPEVKHLFSEETVQMDNDRKGAQIKRHASGDCAFLSEGLCAIQMHVGAAFLPRGCATYPRQFLDHGERKEISGKVSCPELARLCLLEEDAMDIVDDLESPDRFLWSTQSRPRGAETFLFELRDCLIDCYRLPELTVTQQTYAATYLLRRLASSHPDNARRRLERVVPQFRDPTSRQKLIPPDEGTLRSDSLFFEFVTLMLSPGRRIQYLQLVRRIFAHLGISRGDESSEALVPATREAWTHYRQRRRALPDTTDTRIQAALRNFCRNFWFSQSFKENAMDCARCLCMFLAVIRFLLITHPELNEDSEPEQIDRAIVAVVQGVMRAFSHNRFFREKVLEGMKATRYDDLKAMAELLFY